MEIIQSILMGLVQGLSEFLPISSSAHLVFTSSLYKLFTGIQIDTETGEEIFFNMMLHLGTLFAVLIFFKNEILDIIKSLINAIKIKSLNETNAKIGVYIIIATFLTIIVAYPLKDISERLVYSPSIVAILLIFTGLFLIFSEKISKQDKKIKLKDAILIGIAQGLAAFPGFSRSGLTIATGLLNGIDRITCARFSFLLSIPIILGTSILYPFLELEMSNITQFNWISIIIGTIVSAFSGYYCIKYFLKFIAKYSLAFFGYYCIIAGFLFTVLFNIFNV